MTRLHSWTVLVAALALGAPPPGARPADARGPWRVSIRRVSTPADVVLPAATKPRLRGRVLELLMLEDQSEALEGAYLFEVQVRNRSRSPQTLRWDVSRSVRLTLPGGGVVLPIGHKLHDLSENSLAVKGVLEVDIPPQATYRLYPVFPLVRLPRGARLTIDRVGTARYVAGGPSGG